MTARRALARTLCALAALAAASPAFAAGAGDVLFERTLMSAAGARCRLFAPDVAAALVAGGRQARGAALRAGVDPDVLDGVEARARRRAAATACDAPELIAAARKVEAAFAGYSRMPTIVYPGAFATWRAERRALGWRLSQAARPAPGPAVFGLAEAGPRRDVLTFVAGWPGALGASGARLVVRDPAKAPRPYLDPRRKDLAGRSPPRAASRVFLASDRDAAPPELTPAGAASAAAFRFPAAAAEALEALDPREALTIELVYPGRRGERVERITFEVGDFAAGRAFLAAGR
jgi:hypothetical protein